jgi:hypothetical protein
MRGVKGLVIAIEAGVLLLLGAADLVSGQFLGAAIVVGLATLAAACAWALWPAGRALPRARADESPRRAGWSRQRRR